MSMWNIAVADFGMGAVEWDMHEVLQRMQSGELTSPELMQVLPWAQGVAQ